MSALTSRIITIGRSYGAGGRTIAQKVARKLNIPYYDSQLLEKAAKESGLSIKYLESQDPVRSLVRPVSGDQGQVRRGHR